MVSSRTEHTKVGLDLLVPSLQLTVCLWVVCGGESALDTNTLQDRTEQLACELRSAVGDDFPRESMEAELFSDEVVSSTVRVNLLGARYEVDEFGVPIGDQMESVVHVAVNNYRWKEVQQ